MRYSKTSGISVDVLFRGIAIPYTSTYKHVYHYFSNHVDILSFLDEYKMGGKMIRFSKLENHEEWNEVEFSDDIEASRFGYAPKISIRNIIMYNKDYIFSTYEFYASMELVEERIYLTTVP